jgi:hypothetical protein
LLAHCRWFSPGTRASSTTKTGRHERAGILLKVALSKQKMKSKLNQINHCHSDNALSLSFCDIFEIRL